MAKIYEVCAKCGEGYSFSTYQANEAERDSALAECLAEAMRFLENAARPEAEPDDIYVPEEKWDKWAKALDSMELCETCK